jgi:hypothetical protein
MGDYNWNSPANVEAAGDAMRESAKTWDEFSDSMTTTHGRFAQLGLELSSFSVVDPAAIPAAQDLSVAYTKMHEQLTKLFGEAVEEFDRMARALRLSADKYEESDRDAAGRMEGVW